LNQIAALRGTEHQKPQVVLITNGRNRSGTEDHMLQVAQGLHGRGYQVAAINSPREDIRWLAEELSASGIEVNLISERQWKKLGTLWRFVRIWRALRRYRDGILHLQFNGHPSGEMTMLAAKLAGIRYIIRTEHNPPGESITPTEQISIWLRDLFLARIIVPLRPG
jgi:hypothetical protein